MFFDTGLDRDSVVHMYNAGFSAIKKDEVLSSVAIWRDLGNIMLSEMSEKI